MTDTDSDVAELLHFISTGDWRVPSFGRARMPQQLLSSQSVLMSGQNWLKLVGIRCKPSQSVSNSSTTLNSLAAL